MHITKSCETGMCSNLVDKLIFIYQIHYQKVMKLTSPKDLIKLTHKRNYCSSIQLFCVNRNRTEYLQFNNFHHKTKPIGL